VLLAIRDVLLRDVRDERIRRVAVRQQRDDRQQHLGYGERGAPIVLQNVQADLTLRVDVAVVDPRAEDDLGRFERILRGERDLQEEYPALVYGTGWSENGAHPVVDVVPLRSGAAVGRRIDRDLGELPLDAFHGGALLLRRGFRLRFSGSLRDCTGGVCSGTGVGGGCFGRVGTQGVGAGTG